MNGIHKIGSDGGGTVALTVPSTSTNTTATLQAQDGVVALTDNIRGFKNYLINGNFDVWQYGTSQTTNGYGSDDMWINFNIGSTKTHSRVITNKSEPFSAISYSTTVVSSVVGAGNACGKQQRIEYANTLSGKTATLSFWAKANATKNISIDFVQYFGSGGTPSAIIEGISATKISITSSWVKYTVTVNIPSIAGKTAGTAMNDSLWVRFWFDAGTDFNSRTANLGHQSGTFDIAQVQLEEGLVATPFEQRPIGLELSLCQRYYWSGTLVELAPTRADFTAQYIKFPVAMRAVPTTVLTAYSSGTVGCLRQQDGSYSTRDQPFTIGCSNETIYMFYSTGVVAVVGAHYTGYITASAEL